MRGRGWDSLGERRGEKGTAKRKRRVLHQNSHRGHSCADGPLSMSTHQTRASSRDGQLCVATSRGTRGARSQAGLGIKLLQGLSCAQEECTLFLALYSPSPPKKNCLKFLNRMLGKKEHNGCTESSHVPALPFQRDGCSWPGPWREHPGHLGGAGG